MRKFLLSTAVLSALIIGGCATDSTDTSSTIGKGAKTEDTVATYSKGEITSDELYERMKESYGETTLQQMLIEDVLAGKYGKEVTDETVNKAFEEEKAFYPTEEEFVVALEGSGYTEDAYKDIIRYSMLMEATVKENTAFTDEEIKKAYDEYEAPIKAAHILVTDEDLAKDLIKQLNDGGDFKKLAKEHSEDTGTVDKGGEVTFSKGEMVPEFEAAAFAMKEGELTKEPVASDYGFHVIKTIKKAEKGTLEKEKATIEENLMAEKLADTEYVSGIIAGVLKESDIKITDKDLETAMDMYLKEPDAVEESSEEVEVEGSKEAVDSSGVKEDEKESSVPANKEK